MTRNNIDRIDDVVGHLPTINAPATEMSTVQEILNTALNFLSALQLNSIAMVLDQAFFAKATEIAWKHPDRYDHILLMMGNFHTICNFMSSIGKMFSDAGLRDVAVESSVIAEGSVNKVMEGKQYNQAVRLHKLCYEAFMRLAWKGFKNWLESDKLNKYADLKEKMRPLHNISINTCHETLEAALLDESCSEIIDLFAVYLNDLRHSHGQMAQLWMTYVDMVEVLLWLVRADREGNWNLNPPLLGMHKTNYSLVLCLEQN